MQKLDRDTSLCLSNFTLFPLHYRLSICSHTFGAVIGKLHNYSLSGVSISQRTNPSFTSLSNGKFMNCLKTSFYIENKEAARFLRPFDCSVRARTFRRKG